MDNNKITFSIFKEVLIKKFWINDPNRGLNPNADNFFHHTYLNFKRSAEKTRLYYQNKVKEFSIEYLIEENAKEEFLENNAVFHKSELITAEFCYEVSRNLENYRIRLKTGKVWYDKIFHTRDGKGYMLVKDHRRAYLKYDRKVYLEEVI